MKRVKSWPASAEPGLYSGIKFNLSTFQLQLPRHHQYMCDAAYRKKCAIRAGVEASVSELTRGYGMRKSRHRKRSRTKLQLIFAALACNVQRFIRYGEKYAYLEPKFT